ncbi:glycosyltransferase [Treponema sp. TIM-1]|uniref:glycosyltransferase family 1 protein n=1 Tax=Treponema sp. TIM-1 TaxID=2898417 RepID=UPI00397F84AB
MKIALVHYHLHRGGVTSVMYNQAQALLEGGDEVLIITGDEPPADAPFSGVCVKALQYDRPGTPEAPARDLGEAARNLADALLRAMETHWGVPADIIHVHNPLIQKNAALVPALNILTSRGLRFLLQTHDLAEDFRPDVYMAHDEYPENCHYAVINSRDYSFLHRAGLKTPGLHLLPNEVFPLNAAPGLERKRYLYPVRAIKRKNLGEALFLSLFIPKGKTIAITLPPNSEKDNRVYRFWVELAKELKLPVEFEIGSTDAFSRIIGSAYCAITTSVKEGFGFSFLEPWLAGRAVIGRRIDYVCKDFEEAGIRFDSLYPSINIPMVYISQTMLRKKMDHTIAGVYDAFGLEPPHYIINMLNNELFSREELDFGRMDEESQEYIIRTMVSNEAVFRDIAEVNPFLTGLAEWRPDEDLIARNREVISEVYGRERIRKKIRDVYQAVYTTPVMHKISKTMLLELYLDPLRLSLVEVGNE